MSLALYPSASAPHLSLPFEYDRSTSPKFILIFENPDRPVLFLLDARPYALGEEQEHYGPLPPAIAPHLGAQTFMTHDGEVAVRAATTTWRSRPDDAVLPNAAFPGRISAKAFSLRASLFPGLDPTEGSSSRGSEIEVLWDTGDAVEAAEMDRWSRMGWDGRDLTIRAGLPEFDYEDFGTVAAWTMAGIAIEDGVTRIVPRDRGEVLDRALQQNLYGGTGGADGHAGLAGAPKPFGGGRIGNAEPVLLDQVEWTYQLHDGRIHSIGEVRDKGVALAFHADYATYAAMVAASIPGGSYGTCLAGGYLRLGSEPAGDVTVDFRGDARGGIYVETCASLIRRIVTTRLGARSLHDPKALDAVAFARLEAAWPAPIGFYATASVTVREVLRQIERSFYGSIFHTRDGRLSVLRFERPAAAQFKIDSRKTEIRGAALAYTPPPPWRVLAGYARNWHVQSQNDLAGQVESVEGALERYTSEYRHAVAANDSVRSRNRLSPQLEWPTLLAEQADAEALAAHIIGFSDPPIRRRKLTVLKSLLRLWVGDTIELRLAASGLSGGLKCVVADVSEDYASGRVEIEVVG